MKVALFVHCFFPEHFHGTETYTWEIARNLRELGHHVTVVAGVFQGEAKRAAVITRYEYQGIPVVALDKNFEPHGRVRETYWQEALRPHIRRVLAELQPDIVHVTHLINHTAVLLDEVKQAGYPLVATLTDFFGFCANNRLEAADGSLCEGPSRSRQNCVACYAKALSEQPRPDARLLERLLGHRRLAFLLLMMGGRIGWPRRWASVVPDLVARPEQLFRAYQAYDAMIVPTQFMREAYIRNGFDEGRLHLSRFGTDIPRRPIAARDAAAPLVFGFIGQVAPHKGVHLLLEAARSLPSGQAELKIYGATDQNPAYTAQLRLLAGPETSFLGTFPPNRMADILSGIDVLVIPSTWYENSPLVLLNALASHTPVVVSDVQGLTEFVTEGVSGWSFRRGDSADLARVLKSLAADRVRTRAVAATTDYPRTSRSMTAEVVRLYELVMAQGVGAA